MVSKKTLEKEDSVDVYLNKNEVFLLNLGNHLKVEVVYPSSSLLHKRKD